MTKIEISNEEKERYLESIKNMIWSIIHQFNGICSQDKEDIFQETSLFIVNNLIYKYNPERNVAFKDFAYICIKNFIFRKINNINKINRVMIKNTDMQHQVEEQLDDKPLFKSPCKIQKLKILINSNSKLLKDNEKAVLKMIIENPKITQREMSEKMGFSFASGVGAILSRFRKRVKEENFLENL
jgi:RNA polymerase sigma factor (sigma-70 family)